MERCIKYGVTVCWTPLLKNIQEMILPDHFHTFTVDVTSLLSDNTGGSSYQVFSVGSARHTESIYRGSLAIYSINKSGGGASFIALPPYIALSYIIKK